MAFNSVHRELPYEGFVYQQVKAMKASIQRDPIR